MSCPDTGQKHGKYAKHEFDQPSQFTSQFVLCKTEAVVLHSTWCIYHIDNLPTSGKQSRDPQDAPQCARVSSLPPFSFLRYHAETPWWSSPASRDKTDSCHHYCPEAMTMKPSNQTGAKFAMQSQPVLQPSISTTLTLTMITCQY